MNRGLFRILNGVFALMFLASAALQWNDPDPWGWTILYVAATAACWVPRSIRGSWMLPAGVGLASLSWALWLAPETLPQLRMGDLVQTMKAETPAIELGREMLGLLIVAAWMVALLVVSRSDTIDEATPQRGG
jgi:hypothetical protein